MREPRYRALPLSAICAYVEIWVAGDLFVFANTSSWMLALEHAGVSESYN